MLITVSVVILGIILVTAATWAEAQVERRRRRHQFVLDSSDVVRVIRHANPGLFMQEADGRRNAARRKGVGFTSYPGALRSAVVSKPSN